MNRGGCYTVNDRPMKWRVTQFLDIFTSRFYLKPKTAKIAAALSRGVDMHRFIEDYMKALKTRSVARTQAATASFSSFEAHMFRNFERIFFQIFEEGDEIVFIEKRICDEDHGIGGAVDLVTRKPDGTFVVIDWKSSKWPIQDSPFKESFECKEPIKHLPNNTMTKYSLQLNFYARMAFGPDYDKGKIKLIIGRVDPEGDNNEIVNVPLMGNEVRALFEMLKTPEYSGGK